MSPHQIKKLLNDLWTDLKPNGSSQLSKLFSKKVFDTPKSIDLIERIIEFVMGQNDIILDFFLVLLQQHIPFLNQI